MRFQTLIAASLAAKPRQQPLQILWAVRVLLICKVLILLKLEQPEVGIGKDGFLDGALYIFLGINSAILNQPLEWVYLKHWELSVVISHQHILQELIRHFKEVRIELVLVLQVSEDVVVPDEASLLAGGCELIGREIGVRIIYLQRHAFLVPLQLKNRHFPLKTKLGRVDFVSFEVTIDAYFLLQLGAA